MDAGSAHIYAQMLKPAWILLVTIAQNRVCIHGGTHVCKYNYKYKNISLLISVWGYVCMYVCMYVCVCGFASVLLERLVKV